MTALNDSPEDVRSEKRASEVAAVSRLALLKWRNTGDERSLLLHQTARDELECRGFNSEFGTEGWNHGFLRGLPHPPKLGEQLCEADFYEDTDTYRRCMRPATKVEQILGVQIHTCDGDHVYTDGARKVA